MKKSKTIYSLDIDNIQSVAEREMGRELNKEELKIIKERIGDYIHWYDCIKNCIIDYIEAYHFE